MIRSVEQLMDAYEHIYSCPFEHYCFDKPSDDLECMDKFIHRDAIKIKRAWEEKTLKVEL